MCKSNASVHRPDNDVLPLSNEKADSTSFHNAAYVAASTLPVLVYLEHEVRLMPTQSSQFVAVLAYRSKSLKEGMKDYIIPARKANGGETRPQVEAEHKRCH